MILVRCFAVVWGLMVIGFITMMLAFPSLIQMPERGTVWGEVIAVAVFFSIIPFPAACLAAGLKTLSRRVLRRSFMFAVPIAFAVFLTNAGNRDLFLNDALAGAGGVMGLALMGWIYTLGILAGSQPKRMQRTA